MRHRLLATVAILLLLNLSALVDKLLRPGIRYFDGEHVVVGVVTVLFAAALYVLLSRVTKGLTKTQDELRRGE